MHETIPSEQAISTPHPAPLAQANNVFRETLTLLTADIGAIRFTLNKLGQWDRENLGASVSAGAAEGFVGVRAIPAFQKV